MASKREFWEAWVVSFVRSLDFVRPGSGAGGGTFLSPPLEQPLPLLIAGPAERTSRLASTIAPIAQRYAVSVLHPPSPAQLLKGLQEHAPRIAVLDVDLCQAFGMEALIGLRHSLRDGLWLAGWTEPSLESLDTLIEGQMRGALAWSEPPVRVAQALDAVCRGEMWFPRAVMQALYVTVSSRGEAWALQHALAQSSAGSSLVLTQRERTVVQRAREGLTNKAIARALGISPDTVKKHLASAYEKLHVHKRRQIAL